MNAKQAHNTTAANLPQSIQPTTQQQLAHIIKQHAIARKKPPFLVNGMKRERAQIYD